MAIPSGYISKRDSPHHDAESGDASGPAGMECLHIRNLGRSSATVPDIDLKLLRHFVTVVDTHGFSAAAEHLHMSQSAVSQNILRLERFLGTRLVNRDSRGIGRGEPELTPAGEALYADAVELLARAERAVNRTRNASQDSAVIRLPVGFGTSTPREVTGAVVRAGAELPGVEVALEYVPWGEERQYLVRGIVELIFLQVAPDWNGEDYEFRQIAERRRVAVFPCQHALASRSQVSLAELAAEPIIDAATDRDFWLAIPRPGESMPPIVRPAARTVEEMLTFVAAGRGMAITSSTVAENNGSASLAFVPIDDLDPARFVIAWARGDRRRRILDFVDVIEAQLRAS